MRYQSDLSDRQWELIKDYFSVGNYGNRCKHAVRELVNAVFYFAKSGCQWRMMQRTFRHILQFIHFTEGANIEVFGKRLRII